MCDGALRTTGQPQRGAIFRGRHRGLLFPAVGHGNLDLGRPALDALQSDHLLEGGWSAGADLRGITEGLQVEVVQQLGEEGCMLFERQDFALEMLLNSKGNNNLNSDLSSTIKSQICVAFRVCCVKV